MPRTPDGREYFTPQQLARIRQQEAAVREREALELRLEAQRRRHSDDRVLLSPQTLRQLAQGASRVARRQIVEDGVANQRRGLNQSAYPQRRADNPNSASANARDRRDREMQKKLGNTKPSTNNTPRFPKAW